jgi:two-component system, cell cycle sensor histidine kinase and response regulator CckA
MPMPERAREVSIELSSELRLLALDAAASKLYGLEGTPVLGRPLGEVVLTDSGPIDWAAHWAAAREGKFEQLMLHRSCTGMRVWVLCRLEARAEGACLRVRRASGREVLEQQPGGGVAAIGKMLAVGGVGLWMDDRITDAFDLSEHARWLHGLSPDAELSPQVIFANMHPDDRVQAATGIQQAIAEGVPYQGTIRLKQEDGSYRPLRVFGGTVHDSQGLPLIAFGGVVDASEKLALQEQLRQLEEQLRAAQRGDVVGRLAAGIAHDFNNILTGILGCCEMLTLGALAPDQREDVEQIRGATARAADLTRELLAFGRRQALRRQVVAPEGLLSEVLSLLRRTVPKNVELQLLPSETSKRVLADVTQLHQVLTNLVLNAAHAMPSGGKVQIGAAQVMLGEPIVARERAGSYVQFVVEDSGPGVPAALRSRIFEPFYTTKLPGQGSGLGLSVAQGIVEQHQGRIEVRDGRLGGARFEVYLPATDQPAAVPSEPPARRAEALPLELRVLLVEDERMVRELTKRILIGAGFRVSDAANADDALALAAGAEFDVLLTDVMLPTMSGPELVSRLRAFGFGFRVVYMSGYPADFVESRVPLAPNDVLVHKPFTTATLVQALRQLPG